ncbi:MAG: cation:proton antiporter subunit C [Verrucomicrobiales bacterium]|nr:cation:proton antiporter subunit C [Verrucomicrobiales bacterium]
MAHFVEHTLQPHFNFWIYVILMMIGLWALIAKNNLIKKLIGLSIFQTAIILFYVSLGVKEDSTIPILEHKAEEQYQAEKKVYYAELEAYEAAKKEINGNSETAGEKPKKPKKPSHYVIPDPDKMENPLPHVLMLTAIVVGVATLGVALAISQMVFKEFGSLEEDEILEELKSGKADV